MLSVLHGASLMFSRSVIGVRYIAQSFELGFRGKQSRGLGFAGKGAKQRFRVRGKQSRGLRFRGKQGKGLGWRGKQSRGLGLRAGRGRASMGYWLMKTEPGEWGWEHQDQNGGVSQWDGVRNALAQIHLRSMREGDHAFFYHSGKGPAVVGVVEIVKAAYPDVSDDTGKSSMVDVRALAPFPQPVPLSVIKSDDAMRDWILLRQSRLSVMPVSPDVWRRVCALGELSPPLCRTNDDEDAIAKIKPERKTRTKKRGKADAAGAQMQSAKEMRSENAATEIVKLKEQSTETDDAAVAEMKTYQRYARRRSASIELSVVKTYKARRVKKLPGDDTTPNPKP